MAKRTKKSELWKNRVHFGNVLDFWLERKKIGLKESSYVKYFNLINNHIKPSLGKYRLADINSTTLNSYILEKHKAGRCKSSGGLSEKTLKDIATVIKSALRFAKEERLLSDVPFINIIFPREKPKEMRVLTKNEQAALEKYLCEDMDKSKLGILLCLYTGLRIGEICSLRWRDISLNSRTLTVSSTMQRMQTLDSANKKTKVLETEPKSDCSLRTIPLPDMLVDKLAAFRPIDQNAYVLSGKTKSYIEPRTYHNHFKAHIAAAGIKNANFHATRHTFATRCVEVGFEIKSLSEVLGHANVIITLNRYVHPSFDLKRSNMNKLEFFGIS
ncbi:MAG: site-specific integrase [Turicibacter sp.]|nr:site-specific integrase [Turicibacter sp.]